MRVRVPPLDLATRPCVSPPLLRLLTLVSRHPRPPDREKADDHQLREMRYRQGYRRNLRQLCGVVSKRLVPLSGLSSVRVPARPHQGLRGRPTVSGLRRDVPTVLKTR